MPRWSAPLLALALAGALTACGEDAEVPRPSATSTFTAGEVPVLQPGAPGEAPEVLPPGAAGTMPNAQVYRDEDVRFMTDMVAHHTQALRMAELAPERAQDERVTGLASRIAAGQQPEIQVMQTWLRERGLPEADTDADHTAHQGMPGMATPEQMTRLVAARGTAFDRLFLELMSAHHEGALTMAEQAVGAAHPVVTELVDDTCATQSVEITRMQEVLAALPQTPA